MLPALLAITLLLDIPSALRTGACPPSPPPPPRQDRTESVHDKIAPPGKPCASADHCVAMGPGMPSVRNAPEIIWTGDRLIVWGGDHKNDGAVFDPAANTWTPIATEGAPPAQSDQHALWSGRELLVWHSYKFPQYTVSAYDLATRRWREAGHASAPSLRRGDLVYGFYRLAGEEYPKFPSIAFDPATGKVRELPLSPLSRRDGYEVVYTGDQLIVWGGRPDGKPDRDLGDGVRFDFASATWRPLRAAGAPSPRHSFTMLWDGERVQFFGGWQHGNHRLPATDGASYDPRTDRWGPLAADPDLVPSRALVPDGRRVRATNRFEDAFGPTRHDDLVLPRPRASWEPALPCEAKQILLGVAGADLLVEVDGRLMRWSAGRYTPIELFTAPRDGVSYVWTGTSLLAWGGHHYVTTDRTEKCRGTEEGAGFEDCVIVEVTRFMDGVIYTP